jgi:hypothetical protein
MALNVPVTRDSHGHTEARRGRPGGPRRHSRTGGFAVTVTTRSPNSPGPAELSVPVPIADCGPEQGGRPDGGPAVRAARRARRRRSTRGGPEQGAASVFTESQVAVTAQITAQS